MSDKRKNGRQALVRYKWFFITLSFVLFHVGSVNSTRAPLVESVTHIYDVGTQYSGNLGFNQPSALVITGSTWIVADTYNHRLIVTDSAGSTATVVGSEGSGDVQFKYPSAVTIDSSNRILVADTYNSRIQVLDSSYGFLFSFPTTESSLGESDSRPFSFWYIAPNTLWVADSLNSRIKMYQLGADAASTSMQNYFTKDPVASGSSFSELLDGIAFDTAGYIYVADDYKVDQFEWNAGVGTWIQDVGYGVVAYPQGITFDDLDRLVVCDTYNDRVVVFEHQGSPPYTWIQAGIFGGNGVGDGQMRGPTGVYFASNNYYVMDSTNNRIQWFDKTTLNYQGKLAQPTPALGELKNPNGIAYDSTNHVLYVTNSAYNRIEVFTLGTSVASVQANYGSYAYDTTTSNSDKFNDPAGLTMGQDNKLYVADTDNDRILSFDVAGYSLNPDQAYVGGALAVPQKATQCGSFVFVANRGNQQVAKYDLSGNLLLNIPASPVYQDSTNGHFFNPNAVICGIGANEIVVVDQGNNRLQVLDYSLNYIKSIGLPPASGVGSLTNPVSVTIIDSRYWVLEPTQIVVFDTDGTPLLAFLSAAELNDARDIASGEGYIFVADTGNNDVQVYCAGLPVTGYMPNPVVYMGVPIDLDLAVVSGGIGASYTAVFGSVPAGLTVTATTTYKTGDTVHLSGAASIPGVYNVTATISDSNGCSAPLYFLVNISDSFPFVLTSYEPVAQVPTSGNQNITIFGMFDLDTAKITYPNFTLSIYIGGNPCLKVSWNDSGIICEAPEGTGYQNSIYGVISEPSRGLYHTSLSTYQFSYRAPNITDITLPPTGFPINGGLITVTGDSFGATSDVRTAVVKGLQCTDVQTIVPHHQFSCILPYGAGNLNSLFLEVGNDTTGRLNASTPAFFEAPDASCTTPGTIVWAGISTNGGNDLVICGENFGMYELGQPLNNRRKRSVTLVGTWEGTREVFVKNRKCEITFINDTLIHCTIPPGAGTHNKVWVNINSDINSWLLLDVYVHYPRPILTHIVPSRGLVPGLQITVYGKNFAYYAPEAKKTVTIGDDNACNHVVVLNDGELTCIVGTGSGDNQPVVVTVADQSSIPILTVDFRDHFTPGLACEAPFGAQNPWFDNRDICNCFSGYAPSGTEQTDCGVAAQCPGHELSLAVANQYAPLRPRVAFANDRLEIIQVAPIVKDRRDVHIRFEIPQNTLGIPAGKPGAESCWYPGVLWTKAVDTLDCQDVFHATMPWSQQGLCGFIQDSNPASTNVEFKSELVTEWRDIIMERGQLHQKLRSVAFLVTVQFIRQLKISSGSVSVLLADPTLSPIDVAITSGVLYDPAIQNILFTFVTTVEYPYQIDTSVPLYASYAPFVPGNVTVYAIASSPQPGNLQCDLTSSTTCEQEWQAVMIPGAGTCTIQGALVFNTSQMHCRDVDDLSCPSTGNYATSFTLGTNAIRVCDDQVLDATAQTTATITPYLDSEFTTATSSFSVGDTAYFQLQVIDPLSSIDSVFVNEVVLQEASNPSQTLYSLSPAVLVSGIHLNFTNVDTRASGVPVPPGAPVIVPLYFDLNRAHLTSLNGIEVDGASSLIVEVTLDVNYHGNKKRQISFTTAPAPNSISAATPFNVVLSEDELLDNNFEDGQINEFGDDEFSLWASGTTTQHTTTATVIVALVSALVLLLL